MAEFAARVDDRSIRIAVVGLGYVGLPLAIGFAEGGFRTTGFDIGAEVTARLQSGRSHIGDVADERVAGVVAAGTFEASSDATALEGADAVFICVPTPFDQAKSPDLTYVRSATETVAASLRPGMLVVLQSTTYPGTTTEVVQPILEGSHRAESPLVAGVDFNLAFSPERVDPGNATWTVRNTPKVVGGITPECADRTRLLLESIMDGPGLVTVLSSPAAAELTKLLENTYRAVNIALVNELAVLAHEMRLDLWEVIDGAATKPFGFQAFYPGVGPGGHCIPVDPYYLSWRAREFDFQTKFIELAADTNLRMAPYVCQRIQSQMNREGRALAGARILCLGAAFKAGVADLRNSRSVRVMELLEAEGAEVLYADTHIPTLTLGGSERKSVALTDDVLASVDGIAILQPSAAWPIPAILAAGRPVFDAVNATRGHAPAAHLERL